MDAGTILLATALGTLAAQLLLWLASVRLRDASIVDIYWASASRRSR
jgi:steroid 5-alpha reductase family enzyme